jgi:bifunctional non-homologous end joining protein LigD
VFLDVEPMLAHPSKTIAATPEQAVRKLQMASGWHFDLKWDGIRAVVFIDHGSISIKSRIHNDITWRYPDVATTLAAAYPRSKIVLDGELVVIGKDGKPDFWAAHKRDAQGTKGAAARMARTTPATFVPFDLLWWHRTDRRDVSYLLRASLLQHQVDTRLADLPNVKFCPPSAEGQVMWDFIHEQEMEGLIAKRSDAPYRGGRQHTWIKIKPTKRLSALVAGIDGQKDALLLRLLDEKGQLVDIGRVGSGISGKQMREVVAALETHRPVIVDIDYMSISPQGQLRMPVFKGVRRDVDLLTCTIDQL